LEKLDRELRGRAERGGGSPRGRDAGRGAAGPDDPGIDEQLDQHRFRKRTSACCRTAGCRPRVGRRPRHHQGVASRHGCRCCPLKSPSVISTESWNGRHGLSTHRPCQFAVDCTTVRGASFDPPSQAARALSLLPEGS
jgi:hypothetical protein